VSRTQSVVPIVTALMSLVAGPLVAQDPDSAVAIDPILVRVLRSTVGTGTPQSISIASGSELTRSTAGVFLEQALRAVPGIQIQNRFNLSVGERISIRGFGSRAQFGIRSIRVLVDGIPATLPDGQATLDHLDLAGLGRVEVLRGPSAALYGNAAGGVLHFRTLEPALVPAAASVRTTSGSNGLQTWQGVVSGQAGDAGYRVGFSRLTFDGFRRNPVADDGSVYGGATRSVVNAALTLPMAGGSLRLIANGVDLSAENPGSVSATSLAAGERGAAFFNVSSGTRKDLKQGQAGATWTGPLAGVDAEISTWVVKRELDNPIPGRVIDIDRHAGGVRALFRGQTDAEGGTFGIGAGFEAEFQRDDRINWGNDGGERTDLRLLQLERVRSGGLFVQGRLDLDSGVSFLGGVRYDRLRFTADDRLINASNPDDSGKRLMDALSPSAGFVIDAGRDLEVFGSVASSFETPTTTELVNRPSGAGGFNPDLEPQKGFSVEAGVRGRAWEDASFELALFQTKLTNELVPFQVPSDPSRDYFQNAGKSTHRGWEVAFDSRLGSNASARIAYTRVNGSFDEFVTDEADYSGNKIPGLAPHRIDGLFQAEFDVVYLELRGLFQDDIPVDNEGEFSSESFFVADARLGLDGFVIGGIEVSPFVAVQNVFDVTYTSSVVVNHVRGRFFEPGPSRTFLIGAGITVGR
jgi:iron complex outermembrane receptor protein